MKIFIIIFTNPFFKALPYCLPTTLFLMFISTCPYAQTVKYIVCSE